MLADHGDLNSKNLFFDKLSPSKSRYSFEGQNIDHIEVGTCLPFEIDYDYAIGTSLFKNSFLRVQML